MMQGILLPLRQGLGGYDFPSQAGTELRSRQVVIEFTNVCRGDFNRDLVSCGVDCDCGSLY